MLLRILDSLECIEFVILKLWKTTDIAMLTVEEADVLKKNLSCLKPFADATAELCGEKYVTMTLVLPNISILHEQLDELKTTMKMRAGKALLKGLQCRAE